MTTETEERIADALERIAASLERLSKSWRDIRREDGVGNWDNVPALVSEIRGITEK